MTETSTIKKIENGYYIVGDFTILRGGPKHWQLRDDCDTVIEIYPTLKQAKACALGQTNSL